MISGLFMTSNDDFTSPPTPSTEHSDPSPPDHDDISVHTVDSAESSDDKSIESNMSAVCYKTTDEFGPPPGSLMEDYNRAPPSPSEVDLFPECDLEPDEFDSSAAPLSDTSISILLLRGQVRVCSVSSSNVDRAW